MDNSEQEKQNVIEQICKDLKNRIHTKLINSDSHEKEWINIKDYDLHWDEYTIDGKVYTRDELIFFLQITASFMGKDQDTTILFATFQEGKVPLSEEMELAWCFSYFLDTLPDALRQNYFKELGEIARINKGDINELPSEEHDDCSSFCWHIYTQLHSVEIALEIFFPELFSIEEKKMIADKYKELNYCFSSFHKWFIDEYSDIIQDYKNREFQGSNLRWEEYIKSKLPYEVSKIVPSSPISKEIWEFMVWIVNTCNDDYRQWENEILTIKGHANPNIILYRGNFKELYFYCYYLYNKLYWKAFVAMMNNGSLDMDECNYILAQLKERGLSQYVQKRYDEYRRITGLGRDIPFASLLNVSEVSKAMSIFFDKKVTNGELEAFTNAHLPLIIKETVPKLKASDNSLNVVGFALVLWKSKYFNKNYFDNNFSKFRDEIIKIFQFSCSTKYTEGNTKLVNAAKKLWTNDSILNTIITSKEINRPCTHQREKQRKKYEKMREEREKQKNNCLKERFITAQLTKGE